MNNRRSKRASGYTFTEADLLAISQDISRQHSPVNQSTPAELVIVPVDPYHLHASWNLSFCVLDDKQLQRNPWLDGFILRVFHLMTGWFDVKVEGLKNDRRLRLPLDDSHYSAEIGVVDLDGQFSCLLRSKNIQVPRAEPVMAVNPLPQPAFDIEKSNQENLSETLQTTVVNDACYPKYSTISQLQPLQFQLPGNDLRNCCFGLNDNPSDKTKSFPLTYSGIGWARKGE